MEPSKLINTLVVDSGPIIRNQPAVSSLIASANEIVTLPSVINEIRDPAARSRLDTTLKPFLTLRDPKPESLKFVQTFARKTGDLSVLSSTDMRLIALAYEIEVERNGGDWRLRNTPGQKTMNGPMPSKKPENSSALAIPDEPSIEKETPADPDTPMDRTQNGTPLEPTQTESLSKPFQNNIPLESTQNEFETDSALTETPLETAQKETTTDSANRTRPTVELASDSDSDSEDWITPSNLSKHQAKDAGVSISQSKYPPKMMQVATLTTDFAMQNVLLQINLNLLSPSLERIRHLKSFIKRCHACFMQVKDMDKQFCPRCGKDTLTKVACSTNSNGEFQIHLKKNMQWNNRGNRYSIPKAVHGSANGKVEGGGQGGWGSQLILTEDQKEYVRALGQEKRTKQKDLMDEDVLPAILSGVRGRVGGRPKVGAGRNVNSKKRK